MAKRRGRERLITCEACNRQIPRDKAIEYFKAPNMGDINLDNVVVVGMGRRVYYCISCAKHRGIFEKKKKRAQKIRERRLGL